MNHVLRTAALAAATLAAIALPAVAGAAPPASAAIGCYASSCAGHDPTTHGCSATSTTTTAGTLATVWNRYSYGCDANWARGQLTAAALRAGDTMSVEIFTTDSANNFEEMTWPTTENDLGLDFETSSGHYGGSSIAYSDMVDGTNTTDAYVLVYNASGAFLTLYAADQ